MIASRKPASKRFSTIATATAPATAPGSLEDSYWKLGVRRATARTLVEASFGERSFGSTLNAKIRRALNKGSIELAYREDPSVQEQLFEQRSTDPTPEPPGVPGNIDRPGVGDRPLCMVGRETEARFEWLAAPKAIREPLLPSFISPAKDWIAAVGMPASISVRCVQPRTPPRRSLLFLRNPRARLSPTSAR